eukprot:1379194-Pleurochrysis_carterae.AAC.2
MLLCEHAFLARARATAGHIHVLRLRGYILPSCVTGNHRQRDVVVVHQPSRPLLRNARSKLVAAFGLYRNLLHLARVNTESSELKMQPRVSRMRQPMASATRQDSGSRAPSFQLWQLE